MQQSLEKLHSSARRKVIPKKQMNLKNIFQIKLNSRNKSSKSKTQLFQMNCAKRYVFKKGYLITFNCLDTTAGQLICFV